VISILQAQLPGSIYENRASYVVPGRYFRRHTRFRPTLPPSAPTRSLQEVTVMCTRGPSTVQGFVLNVCGCVLRTVRKKLLCHVCLTYSHSQLSDVVKVLCYLRFCNVIHGDPNGVRDYSQSRFITTPISTQSNGVLVGDSGHARIAATVINSVKSDSR